MMYYYFQVRFKEDNDIYIVRVESDGESTTKMAEARARKIIVNKTKRLDFEIERATIESLLSQATFVEDTVTVRFTL